jgi:hypothetical protein
VNLVASTLMKGASATRQRHLDRSRPRGADHEDVLRRDLGAQLLLTCCGAVAQRAARFIHCTIGVCRADGVDWPFFKRRPGAVTDMETADGRAAVFPTVWCMLV